MGGYSTPTSSDGQWWETGLQGILYFPATPMTESNVNLPLLRDLIQERLEYCPGAIFVACGTGEFSALGLDEYRAVVAAAVEVTADKVPVIAGTGYAGGLARNFALAAADAGADGLLVLPTLSEATSAEALTEHYRGVADASVLPIILYRKNHARIGEAVVRALGDHPRIVGIKDGSGDLETLARLRRAAPKHWLFFNGMPTAELSYDAYAAVGVQLYSSAVFAFLPEIAHTFYTATVANDIEHQEHLIRAFFDPFATIRDRAKGYPVSLIKAGLRARGVKVGFARPPTTNPSPEDMQDLTRLIDRMRAEGMLQ